MHSQEVYYINNECTDTSVRCYVSSRSETHVLYVGPTCLCSLAALGEFGSAYGVVTAWPRCWTHLFGLYVLIHESEVF